MITPRITAVNPWEVLRYLGAGQGETPAELLETVRPAQGGLALF